MSNEVYIVSGCRTAIGNFQGQFEKFSAVELGTAVISEAVKRASLKPEDVDSVIMGQVLTAGQGQNPARQSSVKANIPTSVPAFTVNMLCGSGLKSVALGYQAIRNQENDIVVAGGQESMTRSQHCVYLRGLKMGMLRHEDSMLLDGLTDAFHNCHMGKTAEHLAKEYNVPREAQDEYSEESQTKAQTAIENGHFKDEILVIIDDKDKVAKKKVLDTDEFPKKGTNTTTLSLLNPAFDKENGTVTAGNASGINDGAAAVVLCSGHQLKSRNLKPFARIVATAEVGVDPMCMGLGPVGAVKKVLAKAGWNINDVDLFELNEAFAVQSIVVVHKLKVNIEKVNVSGGAVALGHPIGASGTRILVTLMYNLRRLKKNKGIAALCIGGGMGIAVAIEMCNE